MLRCVGTNVSCVPATLRRPAVEVFRHEDKEIPFSPSPPRHLRLRCANGHPPQPAIRGSSSRLRHLSPPHAFSGQESSENQSDPFSMDSLRKALEGRKREKSVPDMLQDQLRGFGGDGGSRDRPGSGGGGDSDSEGESKFSDIVDEFVQVIMATLGLIFVYIYIIRGEELWRLVRDYIKYLFGARSSVRLRRAMRKWRLFSRKFIRVRVDQERSLAHALLMTPTWWHDPDQLFHSIRTLVRRYQVERQQRAASTATSAAINS